jgi:hypothetical protein
VTRSEVDYFIRCVLTISLRGLYYGCFNFMCLITRVCVFVILTFPVFCLCTLLFCSYFVVLMFYSCVVVLLFCVIFVSVCTSVGLLPPGESPR